MKQIPFPVSMARLSMSFAPAQLVARVTEAVVARMEKRHPKLFKNLARLDPALVHFQTGDLPHRFALTLGREPVRFYLVQDAAEKPEALISGSLESLIAMLEGREDGDALFFSRDIQVAGDTTIVVGLRNTLDREEIDLTEEILGLFGPFAKHAEKAIYAFDFLARRARTRLSRLHEEMHRHEERKGS